MRPLLLAIVLGLEFLSGPIRAEVFRIGTFNVENYLDGPAGNRPVKTDSGKEAVNRSLLQMNADVVALQEMGSSNALVELQQSLKSRGLDYPHREWITGFDTNIHIAVFSRFPFLRRQLYTNEGFLLGGRRFQVSRGFAELEIAVNPAYRFTLLTAHLKSRRPIPEADEAELREQEAILLREKIDRLLRDRPSLNLIVLGDFNDTPDSRSLRRVIGRGNRRLIDTRPAEVFDRENHPGKPERQITWTHFYAKEDVYGRIDYILLSPGMAREWKANETKIVQMPDWGAASDHRPIVAAFVAEDL